MVWCPRVDALVCWLLLPSIVATGLSAGGGFGDDDCELAPDVDVGVPWRLIREQLAAGGAERAAATPLAQRIVQRAASDDGQAAAACPLGVAAACIVASRTAVGAAGCAEGLALGRLLATRWPLLDLLAECQSTHGGSGGCESLAHPSIEWSSWLSKAVAFSRVMPPWILMWKIACPSNTASLQTYSRLGLGSSVWQLRSVSSELGAQGGGRLSRSSCLHTCVDDRFVLV